MSPALYNNLLPIISAFWNRHFIMSIYRFFQIGITSLLLALPTNSLHASESALPSIGGGGYSVTPQDEHELGQVWVRMLRGSARLYDDPIVVSYLEDLLWDVTEHSQLTDRRLELVVLDNTTLNAFAVPGGIVGIHTGLVEAAETEDELASVIAHELAHLSQRHYAAQIDEQRRNRPFMLAALLGSILVAAADAQGGTAAITSTVAAAQQASLAFSRQNEREADYIGMQTLSASGFDPRAMASMFSRLQTSARYGQKPPEFLLTHPVTENRIADSLNRAASLPTPARRTQAGDYALIRARIAAHYSSNPEKLLSQLQAQRQTSDDDRLRYATAIAAIKAKKFDDADVAVSAMTAAFRQKLIVRLITAELALGRDQLTSAHKALSDLLKLFPDNYSANALYVELLLKQGQTSHAVAVLRKLVEQRPTDSNLWYNLAETQGLAGNTLAVHLARIEYFMLTANIDLALRQIKFAQRLPQLSNEEQATLEALETEAKTIRQQMKQVM
jgi:predicted Zn-dependent protease